MENNPTKTANITYDERRIHINDVSIRQNVLDYDMEQFHIKLCGDDESVYDAEKVFIWTMIYKYLVRQEFTHVNDSEHDGIVEIDRYLNHIKIFIKEMTI